VVRVLVERHMVGFVLPSTDRHFAQSSGDLASYLSVLDAEAERYGSPESLGLDNEYLLIELRKVPVLSGGGFLRIVPKVSSPRA
jgi:hypothetical protein